jgi:hypothetical protein
MINYIVSLQELTERAFEELDEDSE